MTRYTLMAIIVLALAGCAEPEPTLCQQHPLDRSYDVMTTYNTHQPPGTLTDEGAIETRVSGDNFHSIMTSTTAESTPIPAAQQTYGEMVFVGGDQQLLYLCEPGTTNCQIDWSFAETQADPDDSFTFINHKNVCPHIPTLQETRNDFITVGQERIDGFDTTHYKDSGLKRHPLALTPTPEQVIHETRHYWITDAGILIRRQTFWDNPEDRYLASAAEQYPNGRVRQEQQLTEWTATVSGIGEANDIIDPRSNWPPHDDTPQPAQATNPA